ncbi:unnamed protein product [Cochlearia groenlandica]
MPSPPPIAITESNGRDTTMLASYFLSLLLPCLGTCFIFLIYLFILWCLKRRRMSRLGIEEPIFKPFSVKGLRVSDLEKLPKLTGEELAVIGRSTECAVCLDDIESGQPARLVPGCNHGFHQLCIDTWLYNHTVCPVCRAQLATDRSKVSEKY